MIDWNDPADWSQIVCTKGGASTQDVTIDSLLALKRQAAAVPRPDFDAVVCLPIAYQRLQAAFQPVVGAMCCDRIYGLPVYFAATALEAACIMRDLADEGKKAMLITEPGDPQQIPKLPPKPSFLRRPPATPPIVFMDVPAPGPGDGPADAEGAD